MTLSLSFADERCAQLMGDAAMLDAMARFESALASGLASADVISFEEAALIARVCREARFDSTALARDARRAGTLAIPFVKALTAQVSAVSPQAARWVHFGATSQDVIDTALVLCLRQAGARILELGRRLGDAAAELARKHGRTPIAARTLLQPAAPIPFGWKAAVWLWLVADAYRSFSAGLEAIGLLQLAGPAGTLAALGSKAQAVSKAVAHELGLRSPDIAWHSARGGLARLGAEAAILSGAAAKIGRDVALLMQAEVGEVFEPSGPGRGGSSSLPHKRNPALSMLALEAGQRAPLLAATLIADLTPEHERGLGQWQSQAFTLRELMCACASGVAAMAEALEGLRVDEGAMRTNLERTGGLVFSEAVSACLARAIGKSHAHALTEKMCEVVVHEGRHLRDVVLENGQAVGAVSAQELMQLFDYEAQFGDAPAAIERVLTHWGALRHQ